MEFVQCHKMCLPDLQSLLSYLPVLRPLRLLVRFEGDLGGRIRAPTTTKLAVGSKWDGRRFQWLLPPAWPVPSLLRQPAGSCFIDNIDFQDSAGSEARPLRNGWFCCMFNCQFSQGPEAVRTVGVCTIYIKGDNSWNQKTNKTCVCGKTTARKFTEIACTRRETFIVQLCKI